MLVTKVNGTDVVTGKAQFFIVPNRYQSLSDTNDDSLKDQFKKISELNNLDYEESYPPVQVWITSEDDFHSENLGDHGFTYRDPETNKPYMCYGRRLSMLPYNLIKDMKEGDSKEVVIPMKSDDGYDENHNVELHITLEAAQKPFRYGRFGTFESVLRYVR